MEKYIKFSKYSAFYKQVREFSIYMYENMNLHKKPQSSNHDNQISFTMLMKFSHGFVQHTQCIHEKFECFREPMYVITAVDTN